VGGEPTADNGTLLLDCWIQYRMAWSAPPCWLSVVLLLCVTAANQSTVKRTMVISSREEVAALNALYKQGDGFGERTITFTNKFGEHHIGKGVGVQCNYCSAGRDMQG